MQIKILYFASLRDALGRGSEAFDFPGESATVAEVRDALAARGDPWARAFGNLKRIRAAVNQEMAADADPVKDGDEVAFFPPVTGG